MLSSLTAWGEATIFIIPALCLLALAALPRLRRTSALMFLIIVILTGAAWRCVFTFINGAGGTRYHLLPVLAAAAFAAAGFAAPALYLKSRRLVSIVTAGLLLAAVGLAIGKTASSHAGKRYIRETAAVLKQAAPRAILYDCTAGGSRFNLLLPELTVIPATGHQQLHEAAWWRRFLEFLERHQGSGREIYLLLRREKESPVTAAEYFRSASLREWGFCAFTAVHRCTEGKYSYDLLRFTPPERLAGLPAVTAANPNPFRLQLPAELHLQRHQPYTLKFADIGDTAPFLPYGGVEVRVRQGDADDSGWYCRPDDQTPEEFPLEIVLYLPNGWPAGYAKTTVKVSDAPAAILPPCRQRELPAAAPEPPLPEIAFNSSPVPPKSLRRTIFWIGSRGFGTGEVIAALRKRQPALRIMRLEDFPRLPYSNDPRYTFTGLTRPRTPVNPLLNAAGEPDWAGYFARQPLPEPDLLVLALGYEETAYPPVYSFHIDEAADSLRQSLTALRREFPALPVLLVMPSPPAETAEAYRSLVANPWLYGFRRGRKHAYRRLAEALRTAAAEFPGVTVVPTWQLTPPGTDGRHPGFIQALECGIRNAGR